MTPYDLSRQNMVNSQIMPNGVMSTALIEAFGVVPREVFVPPAVWSVAYSDSMIDLGQGRAMLAPMVLGKMIDVLDVGAHDAVLCVGGATGYSAAILSWIAGSVTDLESDDQFTAGNRAARAAWAVDNVTRVVGDFRGGAKSADGYDAILVEGAVSQPPYDIALSLKPGGRMVAIIRPTMNDVGTVFLFEKTISGHVSSRPLFEANALYLPGFEPVPHFAFA